MPTPSQVLIIDFSHDSRRFIAQQLVSELGKMEIIQANNSQEAIRVMKEAEDIDWIICDWDLPDQSGLELLKKTRKSAKYSKKPFVMLMASQDKTHLQNAIAAGVTDIIAKPFNIATLNKKIGRLSSL